jgi:hypothetical protein
MLSASCAMVELSLFPQKIGVIPMAAIFSHAWLKSSQVRISLSPIPPLRTRFYYRNGVYPNGKRQTIDISAVVGYDRQNRFINSVVPGLIVQGCQILAVPATLQP